MEEEQNQRFQAAESLTRANARTSAIEHEREKTYTRLKRENDQTCHRDINAKRFHINVKEQAIDLESGQ